MRSGRLGTVNPEHHLRDTRSATSVNHIGDGDLRHVDDVRALLSEPPASVLRPATRVVGRDGGIHLARHRYAVGRWLAGETVEVFCGDYPSPDRESTPAPPPFDRRPPEPQ